MTKFYDLHLRVSAEALSSILRTTDKDCAMISLSPMLGRKPIHRRRMGNGQTVKGTIYNKLKTKPQTKLQLQRDLKRPTSTIASCLSSLSREGLVKKSGNKYQAVVKK